MTRVIQNNFLEAGILPNKIALIPNGIRLEPVLRKEKQWTNKVIFVGNLTQQPAKGVDVLLMAWKQVIQQFPSATLDIVGSGDLDTYRQFVTDHGIGPSVRFLGKQAQIRHLLLHYDVFVLPSRREGMSNALLEAMACAMPIVATNISGNQDMIENNVSGLLVPPEDTQELASAIVLMLSDPEKSILMGKNAFKTVSEKCEMEKVVKDYIELYRKILDEN